MTLREDKLEKNYFQNDDTYHHYITISVNGFELICRNQILERRWENEKGALGS